jgi:ribosomal protein S18 acetylase RimI-like enzyme
MALAFERFDPARHDVGKSAGLALGADRTLMPLIFGGGRKGIGRMGRLLSSGGNAFGREHAYVATDDGAVAGITIGASGAEMRSDDAEGPGVYLRCLGLPGFLRMLAIWPVMARVLTLRADAADFYISIVSVDPARRGAGVGTSLVENVARLAREKGCRRAVLDVSIENEGATRFYERLGFRRAKMKRLIPLWDGVGTYTMVREL